MKSFIVLALCLSAVFAAPSLFDDSYHYSEHSKSVNAAKNAAHFENLRENNLVAAAPNEDICALCDRQHAHAHNSAYDSSQASGRFTQSQPNRLGSSKSSSSSSFREEYTSSATAPQAVYVPAPAPTLESSSSSSSFRESYTNSASAPRAVYVPAPAPTFQSSFSERNSKQMSSSNLGGFSSRLENFPSGGLSRRFSSSNFDSFDSAFASSNLRPYMSESERLARVQAQNIQEQNVRGQIQAQNNQVENIQGQQRDVLCEDNINAALIQPSSGSGYRSKSYEKISKSSQQTQYDSTGRKQSSGFLQTAEGEDQNINGKITGFKAATTTIDDNGKRSTYTVHT